MVFFPLRIDKNLCNFAVWQFQLQKNLVEIRFFKLSLKDNSDQLVDFVRGEGRNKRLCNHKETPPETFEKPVDSAIAYGKIFFW